MKTVKRLQAIGLAFVGVLLVTSLCAAQVSTSSITGTVVDKQGLAVPSAKVVAKNEATGVTYDTSTTSAGDYTLSALPPGQYMITVTQPGFRTFTSVHNVLTVGTPLVVDARLELGQMSEVVQVESSYSRVETTNAMVSDVVTHQEVVNLPLNGRNPLNLIVLEPGLIQRSNQAAGSDTHVFGSRDRSHNVTVDGIDANESSNPDPQNNILKLNPDNVQEFRVVTHDATPEYGRNSGANVSIATRGGTNEFHGDVFWYHRNDALNANEWFNNAGGLPKPVIRLHQFGAAGGGPLIKNKTFFFISWQGNRFIQTEPISVSFGVPIVYTSAMRNGIFRFVKGTVTTANGQVFTSNAPGMVDANGQLLPGIRTCSASDPTDANCIASYNIFAPGNPPSGVTAADAKVAALFNSLPLPNNFAAGGDGLNFAAFLWNPPAAFSGPNFQYRVDHKFDDNNNIFVRYTHGNRDFTKGDLLNGRPAVYPGFPPLGEVSRVGRNLAASYRRVFSPNVVNEFTTGFNYFRFFFTFGESNPNFGDFTKVPPYGQECVRVSNLLLTSFRNIDTPFCDTPHTARAVSTLQWVDNLSVIRGGHTVRTGINFRFYRHNDSRGLAGGQNINPGIGFDGSTRPPVGWSNLPVVISSDDNTALLNAVVEQAGIPEELTQTFAAFLGSDTFPGGLQVAGTRAQQYDWYIQDEWKVTRNLTMTYGVRWEFNRPPSDCCGRVVVPDRAIDGSQGTVTFQKADSWFQRRNANAFGPRISFAWNPKGGKTVIRSGYGIYFDTISTFQITAIAGQVPGAALTCRLQLRDGPTGVSAVLTNGCTLPSNFNKTIAGGFPLQLPPPSIKPSQSFSPIPQPFGVAPGVAAFDPKLKVPTVHEWSLTIQRELPWGFVGQIGYIGKRGMRLYRAYDLNQIDTNQPGFLDSFKIAQQNVFNGCKAAGTGCPAGTPPALLLAMTSASFMNSSTVKGFLNKNGLGDLARRIDGSLGFSTFTSKGFPANFFRPNPQFSQIFYFDSGGDSYYHAGIVQLRRRFEKGLTMGLAYTYGKSIDDMSVDPVGAISSGGLGTTGTGSRVPTDVRNFRLDRSRSDFDNTHVLVVDYLYELPFGRGKKWGTNWPGFLNQILGGWSMTGIYLYQTGEPFTIKSGSRTANGFAQTRADLRGPMPSSDLKFLTGAGAPEGPVLWNLGPLITNPKDPNFDCRNIIGTQSFFCIPPPGQFGMGRNGADGPGFWNFDFGVIKNFPITERVKFQFRTELFNVFNHPNFENPRNATQGSATLTSTVFGQTCCSALTLPSTTAVIQIGESYRVIQFAARIQF